MLWIIGIIIYIIIGIGILIWITTTDQWGGLVLEYWWLVIFFYPILFINSLIRR